MKYFHRNYFFLLAASALTTVPVSYTHLDVYKRQLHTSPQNVFSSVQFYVIRYIYNSLRFSLTTVFMSEEAHY